MFFFSQNVKNLVYLSRNKFGFREKKICLVSRDYLFNEILENTTYRATNYPWKQFRGMQRNFGFRISVFSYFFSRNFTKKHGKQNFVNCAKFWGNHKLLQKHDQFKKIPIYYIFQNPPPKKKNSSYDTGDITP